MVMEIVTLRFTDEDLKEKLLPHLENTVFHLTTLHAYHQIIADEEIKNNKDNKLTPSKDPDHSFGRKKGWVCLFNLKNVSSEVIDEILSRTYDFLDPSWFRAIINEKVESNLVYFILDDNYYHMVIDNDISKETVDHCVEKIECWMDDKIPLDYIAKVLLVKSIKSMRKDSLQYLHLLAIQQNKKENG
jgi:hypothetical protein